MPPYLSPGVYVEEVESGARPIEGVGTAVAAFIGFAPSGPVNTPTLVTNWSQYTKEFGEFTKGSYLAHAVFGYFLNGGGACYIVRIGADDEQDKLPSGQLALGTGSMRCGWIVQALEPGGSDVTIEVEPTSMPATPDADEKAGPGSAPADTVTVRIMQNGSQAEVYEGLSMRRNRQNSVLTAVNAKSSLVRLEELSSAELPELNVTRAALLAQSASEPVSVSTTSYVGDPAARTGMGGLEAIDEITMVCVPDLTAAYESGQIDLEGFKAVQLAVIAHCELMGDRMAILDPPPRLNGSDTRVDAQQIKSWRTEIANFDSRFATLYWPQIRVIDPTSSKPIYMPPSGHIAGVWARNDNTRGVWKAPANEVIRGALDIELNITKSEHDLLNPVGVNCIRSFTGRGVRVYGARTLSSDLAWRYVNVRRLFNYLEKSILNNTDWVVFEPNDPDLWARIKRTIAAFLVMEWRKGALFGRVPAEAFYVKCDDETNPAEAIDLGQVMCEIGVAPVKPAEFVIFRLSQFSGGVSLVTE